MKLIPFYTGMGNKSPALQTLTWDALKWHLQHDNPETTSVPGKYRWIADESFEAGNTDYVLQMETDSPYPLMPSPDVAYIMTSPGEHVGRWPMTVMPSHPLYSLVDNSFKIEYEWQIIPNDGIDDSAISFRLFQLDQSPGGVPIFMLKFQRGSMHDIYSMHYFDGDGSEQSTEVISVPQQLEPNNPTKVELYYVSDRGFYLEIGNRSEYLDTRPYPPPGNAVSPSLWMFNHPDGSYDIQVIHSYKLQISNEAYQPQN